MDSMQDLLKSKTPSEPPQVLALKKYAQEFHNAKINVRVSKTHYLITVPSASLAHIFRIETARITQHCDLDRRLVIHIGF